MELKPTSSALTGAKLADIMDAIVLMKVKEIEPGGGTRARKQAKGLEGRLRGINPPFMIPENGITFFTARFENMIE